MQVDLSPGDDDTDGQTHLILGGGGFAGRHVAILLARAGHRVILANRHGPSCVFPPDVAETITWVTFELATAEWATMIAGVDVIHHFAWNTIPATANADPVADLSGNVAATLRLLEAMRRRPDPPRLVFASSGGTVYGKLRQIPVTEAHPLAPITAYGAAKAAVELYMGYYRALYGLDCRVGRVANPFGAGQDVGRGQGAATVFLHRALANQPIEIWGDGEVIRDYIHIADAAAGLVRLAGAPRTDHAWIFNLASGHGVSLNGIIAELEARLERRLHVVRQPGRVFDVPVSVLDVSLARDVLGWAPRLSFAEGIARTVADLRHMAQISTLD